MQYFGGKAKVAKNLSKILNGQLEESQPFVDLFCGSCNIISKIDPNRDRIANDAHPQLMAMWSAMASGWVPPAEVSEGLYLEAKAGNAPDYMQGFIGFGCSFGGKWFRGYARNSQQGRNYAGAAWRGCQKKLAGMIGVSFLNRRYAHIKLPLDALVYCDIPYANTEKYSIPFNHRHFYSWASLQPQRILISEYAHNAPTNAAILWEQESHQSMRGRDGTQATTREILFEVPKAHPPEVMALF